jgi:hypothetical protein
MSATDCETCRSAGSVCASDGGYFCWVCGTESQRLFAESFEDEQALGAIRSIKKRVAASNKREIEVLPDHADVRQYLVLYQFALRLLCAQTDVYLGRHSLTPTQTHGHTRVEREASTNSISMKVKSLWQLYLQILNKNNVVLLDFLNRNINNKVRKPSTKNVNNNKSNKSEETIYPIKPLMLGFIYLAIRLMRFPILACDIANWCALGAGPSSIGEKVSLGICSYYNLWDVLPMEVKAAIGVK